MDSFELKDDLINTVLFSCSLQCYLDHLTWKLSLEYLKLIGHFRVPKTLTFKMKPSAQPFLWKWVLFANENEKSFPYQRMNTCFDTETRGNSKIARDASHTSWKRSIVMTFLWSGTGHGLVHRPMKGNTGYYCFQNLDFLGLEILNSAQGIRNPSSTDKESVSHSVEYRLMACLGLTGAMSIHAATECTPDFPSGLFPAWCGHNLLLAYSRLPLFH